MARRFGLVRTALIASLLLPTAAQAGPACNIQAYTADPDPAGTNVRAGPSKTAPVVVRLPQGTKGDPQFTPEVVVAEFRDGWAWISRATLVDYDAGTDKVLFRGQGWISGKLLSTALNRPGLHARPDDASPEIVRLMGEDWGADSVQVLSIEDCLGDFVKVVAKLPDGRIFTGWADGVCSNQVTTCP